MEPEEFAEKNNIEYKESKMVKGVEFAVFVKDDEEVYYYLSTENEVNETPLEDIGHSGNKTYGVLENGRRVLVDDEEPYVHTNETV